MLQIDPLEICKNTFLNSLSFQTHFKIMFLTKKNPTSLTRSVYEILFQSLHGEQKFRDIKIFFIEISTYSWIIG